MPYAGGAVLLCAECGQVLADVVPGAVTLRTRIFPSRSETNTGSGAFAMMSATRAVLDPAPTPPLPRPRVIWLEISSVDRAVCSMPRRLAMCGPRSVRGVEEATFTRAASRRGGGGGAHGEAGG